jgi:hypothetical protein
MTLRLCLIGCLALGGCTREKRPEVTATAEHSVAIIGLGAGAQYVIDSASEACWLWLGSAEPVAVSCRNLHDNLPAAAEHITWLSEPPAQGPDSPKISALADATAASVPEGLAEGVRAIDETTYEVKTAFLDEFLVNPTELAWSVRVVPSLREGKPNGFKLYAMRPGSLARALGLKNGDTITKLNGQELSSVERAFEVFRSLPTSGDITLDILRRGKPMFFRYRLVP